MPNWDSGQDATIPTTPQPHVLVGAEHLATGLVNGQVIRATGADVFTWGSSIVISIDEPDVMFAGMLWLDI